MFLKNSKDTTRRIVSVATAVITLLGCYPKKSREEYAADMAEIYSGIPVTDVLDRVCRGDSQIICIAKGKVYLCLGTNHWNFETKYECVHMTNPSPLLEDP